MKYLVTCLLLSVALESNFVLASKKHRFGYSAAEQRLWKKKHNVNYDKKMEFHFINHHFLYLTFFEKDCSGPHQSPIAINSRRSISVNMPAIEFIYYHNLLPSNLKVHNDGHSISLLVTKPENFTQFPFIFGGKLKGEYEFIGLHFHWGDKNNRGAVSHL